MDIEPFVLRKRGRYFLFPGTRATLEIILDDATIRIPGPAEVEPGYEHPFVYRNGKICYGTDARFRRQGIQFTKAYDASDTITVGRSIASLFEEVEKVLHLGYHKGARPVNRLLTEQFNHLLISEEEAEASSWTIFRN